ncbi:unnamed protein product [Porites evermanni]|uniref:Apple domain-containing protein n=1 Tax=Porites evermanni TaxID=104178 RepID=A0ABN8RMN9_9CNID|nr:unnamed protein product [Porites evermanni]
MDSCTTLMMKTIKREMRFVFIILGTAGDSLTWHHNMSFSEGHVFSNHSVELNLDCQDQCALARECVSYNIGPKINNKMA